MIASTQTNHPLASVQQLTKPQASIDAACARLKAAGLRITQPRVAIIEALLKRSAPASIEQLHGDLTNAACDLVTVYRCLAAFQEVGLVRLCYFHNGTSLYQIAIEGQETPYHLISKDTKEVQELDAECAQELRTALKRIEDKLRAKGYTEVSHLVEFFAQTPTLASREQQAVSVMPATVQQRGQSSVLSH